MHEALYRIELEWAEDHSLWDGSVPDYVTKGLTFGDIEAIQQGGCASGAYMPAVTYHEALETMHRYGDEILERIEEAYGELPEVPESMRSWAGMACFYVSTAVELWAGSIDLDDISALYAEDFEGGES